MTCVPGPRTTRTVGTVLAIAVLGQAAMPSSARAADALVAVAANFAEVVEELAPIFERKTGHRLQATTGSTGKLYAQIISGAPFEILLSADAETPERLEDEGAGVAGTRFTYAIGRLTLWSSDPDRIKGDGRTALAAPDVRHIAIANPDLAPYGVAAREALQALGLWDELQGRIVMGQNIGQTHSMVATGNAQLGFVALSAVVGARAPTLGSRWDVPPELITPIRQDAILLRAGRENEAARAFLDFLWSDEARTVIERSGYDVE
jgi:molybdate transport system substrate-binding protein